MSYSNTIVLLKAGRAAPLGAFHTQTFCSLNLLYHQGEKRDDYQNAQAAAATTLVIKSERKQLLKQQLPETTTLMLLSCTGFIVTEWRSSQQRRANSIHSSIDSLEETNHPRQRAYNASDRRLLGVLQHQMHNPCDALLPVKRAADHESLLTDKRRRIRLSAKTWLATRRT